MRLKIRPTMGIQQEGKEKAPTTKRGGKKASEEIFGALTETRMETPPVPVQISEKSPHFRSLPFFWAVLVTPNCCFFLLFTKN